jgi:hypothetical protein
MSGFTKLVPEIIQSSIWNEPPAIRVVWIAMIATKDENGYVRGDSRTISRMANVDLKDAEEALEKFQAPDPTSHTQDNDGRRIAPAPGGWIILNHELYRARDAKEVNAERVRRWRKKIAEQVYDDGVTDCNAHVRYPSVSVSASVSDSGERGAGEGTATSKTSEAGTVASTRRAAHALAVSIYDLYPRKVGREKAVQAILRAFLKVDPETLKAKVEEYAAAVTKWPRDRRQFIPHPTTWFNQGRWDDDPAEWEHLEEQRKKSWLERVTEGLE